MKRCDSPIRVVVAEANPIIVQGLTAIVEAREGYRVIASTCDGGQCLELITSLKPEISIIGTSLPNFSGWQIAAAAVAQDLPTRIILMAPGDREHDGLVALNLGAYGFFFQNTAPISVHACLADVAAGSKWLPPGYQPLERPRRRVGQNGAPSLTDREHEVTHLAACGLSNKAIARRLNLSDGTVRIHLQNIFKKLGVMNRTELAVRALAAVQDERKDT